MTGNFDRKLRLPHIQFRVLLHAANMRHGTNGFTSLPKEGVLRIFFRPEKSDGFGRVWTRELWYYECKFVLSGMYITPYLHGSVLLYEIYMALQYFQKGSLKKRYDFCKNFIEHETYILIFSTDFVCDISYLKTLGLRGSRNHRQNWPAISRP